MKRFLLSMAALLAIVGCAKQEDLVSADFGTANAPEFNVGFESSRVFIEEDGEGFKLAWTQGDLLSCFLNAGGQAKYEYVGETGAASGIIKAVSCPAGDMLDAFYAVYPYNDANALTGDELSVVLPAEQSYAEGTFGANSNTMVAVNPDKEPYYTFSNVCGYVRLKVYGEAAITSIEFKGNNEEVIAGAATVNPTTKEADIAAEGGKAITVNCGEGVALGATAAEATEFWVVVPPMTFEKGFTVTLTDNAGGKMTKSLDTPFTVERNNVHDGEIEYVANGEVLVDIKFGANNTAEDKGDAALAVKFIDPAQYNAPEYPAENKPVLAQTYAYGDGYIARFNHTPSGMANQTSFFLADYSENADLQAAMADGFTMEVVYMNSIINAQAARLVSAGSWGLGVGFNRNNAPVATPLRAYCNAPEVKFDVWGTWIDSTIPSSPVVFNHALYVYDQANTKVQLYLNGQLVGELPGIAEFNIGTELAIGAASYIDTPENVNDLGLTGWAGDVASVKIYNSVKSAEEAQALYKATTLPVWNPTESLPQPIYDAVFNDNGSVDNAGTMQSLESERMTTAEGTTPYMQTIKVGNYNVVNFTHPASGDTCPNKSWNPNNFVGWDANYPEGSYYRVGYENSEFDAALVDGDFAIEIICAAGTLYSNLRVPAGTAPFHFNQSGAGYWMQAVVSTVPWAEWVYDSDYRINLGEYHHMVYVSNFEGKRQQCTYINGKQDSQFGGHNDVKINPHCLTIGAAIWPDKNMTRPYNGQVAAVRVYDRSLTPTEVAALYSKAQVMIDELHEVPNPVLADVKFSNGDTGPVATDAVGNYTISSETTGDGSTVSVNNGVATFAYDPANISYFKLDLAQDAALKAEMNDGFTIEFIGSSTLTATDWHCPFGSEGFSLVRLHAWGNKWNINGWSAADNSWAYVDGINSPVANEYNHILYAYDAARGAFYVYRDGVYENLNEYYINQGHNNAKEPNLFIRENSTMLIGARLSVDGVPQYPWGGNLASMKIYKDPVTASEAAAIYAAVKSQVDTLNGK